MNDVLRHLLRNRHDIQGQLRFSAHGIDVRKCIRCGNRAEGIRVVGNRRKEIHGLDQGKVIRDLIDAGVVALIKADQQVRVRPNLEIAKQLGKYAGSNFCAAAGAAGKLGQFHIIVHFASS